MLWGITPENWGELWSGVIGSFVAAVIGGLVALVVVRMTNRQQQDQARAGREIAAMADLAAAAGAMTKKYGDFETIQELLLAADAAAIRWEMDSQMDGVGEEIRRWPHFLGILALNVLNASDDDEKEREAFLRLSGSVSLLMTLVAVWPKVTPRNREKFIIMLNKKRRELTPQEDEDDPIESLGGSL